MLEFLSIGSHSSKCYPATKEKVQVSTFANLPPFTVQSAAPVLVVTTGNRTLLRMECCTGAGVMAFGIPGEGGGRGDGGGEAAQGRREATSAAGCL